MQNLSASQLTALSLELFHVQSRASWELPPHLHVIRIGKPNEEGLPDIDVSHLSDADIVSRTHAEIRKSGNSYYIQDLGSSNGTYINQTKLVPHTPYQINLGDKIDFGQGSKVTFIFQYKQETSQSSLVTATPTEIQPQTVAGGRQTTVDRTSRLLGLVLIVAGVIMLAANTRIGLFVRIPGVLLCVGGVIFLSQRRFNRNIGWILIALGIAVIVFTGNFFASFNLLAFLVASAVLFAGYQLFTTGKILNHSLRSLKGLIFKNRV
ncbi:MAG: FHA domain-containing protein [Nostocaceae cyanobacterium]|nr:FHA domain-containing protein [Nostocaceae cyanobacterium]